MGAVDLFINIIVFVGCSLLMSVICINMQNIKGDNRNTGAGYRTKGSMKSIKSWNVGNKTFGLCAIPIAVVEGIAIFVENKILIRNKILLSENAIFINLLIFFFGIIIAYFVTENRIKQLL